MELSMLCSCYLEGILRQVSETWGRGGLVYSETIDKHLCVGQKSLIFHEFLKGACGPILDPHWEAWFLAKFWFSFFPSQRPEIA